ncbi:hypothetical protein ACFYPT_39210 [Streptomyces sp. NPDC005529]|uniref:hypothetical protein n=1 Tax=unclassified Streptomyces TaxID=2593676 RepID=UPI0033A035BB
MGDLLIVTGDLLQITINPPALVPLLLTPWPLTGSSATAKIMKRAVCLLGDELPPSLSQPMPYTSPPFVIPGTGTLQLILQPANLTQMVKNDHKPMLLKGAVFDAIFTVQSPAIQPTPAGPVSDPVPLKQGKAAFTTTNTVARGQ